MLGTNIFTIGVDVELVKLLLIFFGLSEILIFEFLSFFFSVSEISDKFCVSHCTFKQ